MASSIAGDDDRSRLRAASLLVLAVALVAPPASAASPAEAALAQRFFDEARALFGVGNFHEACPKFAASQKLDPREGTLMNLAICHDKEGKTASAWTEFNDARTQARAAGHTDIEKFASEHVARLTPTLSYLRIAVSREARAPGLTIKLDDLGIDEVAWDTDVPIDPGPHTVQASAPQRLPWETQENVGAAGDRKTIAVPVLRVAEVAVVAPVPVSQDRGPPPEVHSNARRTAGFVIGGVGIASIVAGSVFGVEAISERHQVNACTGTGCGAAAQAINDDGVRDAWVSDVTFGVGIVGLAIGTYMVLTAKPATATAAASVVFTGSAVGFATRW
jgi:hypothetical protein